MHTNYHVVASAEKIKVTLSQCRKKVNKDIQDIRYAKLDWISDLEKASAYMILGFFLSFEDR